MSPFICGGDAILIEPATLRKVQVGDIAAYICPENGILIIHRIVTEKNGKYLLKGDNVFHFDGWIEEKDIHGYVKDVIFLRKKLPNINYFFRRLFLFLNKFKKSVGIFSRYKITTLFCRISNKFILLKK